MVNNPTWLPPLIPGEEPPNQSSLESMANCKFCSDFTLVATKPIKKGQELLILYHFTEEEIEESEEERNDKEKDNNAEESEEEERDNEEKKKKAKKPRRLKLVH
jgi:hypothetical protein